MIPKRILIASPLLLAACVATAVAAAMGTVGGQPPTRSGVLSAASASYPAFARAQQPSDVFTSRSNDAANRLAAKDIAKTSRRVFADARGEAFVFLSNDNEICMEWRPATGNAAGSSCSPAASSSPPGVLMSTDGTMDNPIITGLLPAGVRSMTVDQADGIKGNVPISHGVYVYQGRTPFVLHWREPDGREQVRRVAPIDLGRLKLPAS